MEKPKEKQRQDVNKSAPFVERESFRRINAGHSYPLDYAGKAFPQTEETGDATPHRGGILGKLKLFLEARLFTDYFRREAQHSADLVHCINTLAETLETREERHRDELSATAHRLEIEFSRQLNELRVEHDKEIGDARSKLQQQENHLQTLESVSRGLERIVSRLSSHAEPSEHPDAENESADSESIIGQVPNYNYLLLENRYRGSEEEISKRLEMYSELFGNNGLSRAAAKIFEIGSGRGELQTLFRDAGIPSYGMDLDAAMVELCREKGLDVLHGDALKHLSDVEERSLGGVIAIQVVEHLTLEQLERLFVHCTKKVVSGGIVVFETINTESLLALGHNYFRDPTHVWPLHPETLGYTMDLHGLRVVDVIKRSPYPKSACLQEIELSPELPPRWHATVTSINHNTRALNDLLYGYQDYCIVAEVP